MFLCSLYTKPWRGKVFWGNLGKCSFISNLRGGDEMVDNQSLPEQTSLSWINIVKQFTEICREFEYLTEKTRGAAKREETLEKGKKWAKEFDQIRKDKSILLFGNSNNLYDAENQYKFSQYSEISIDDLSRQIDFSLQEDSGENVNVEEVLENKKEYLQAYFGVKYEGEWSKKEIYQIHQLLLILYKCENRDEKGKRGILKNMQAASFWRFRNEKENPYYEQMFFIRQELLKALYFEDAIVIEYVAGLYRFCINSLAEATVQRVIDELVVDGWDFLFGNYESEIHDDLYKLIVVNLKRLNSEKQTLVQKPNDLFGYAYLRFLLLGIEDTIEEPRMIIDIDQLHKEESWRFDVHPVWQRLDKMVKFAPKKIICVDESKNLAKIRKGKDLIPISDFVKDSAKDIAREIWQEKFEEKHYVAIRRGANNYSKLALLYSLYTLKTPPYEITIVEILTIIHLYENCKSGKKTQRTGYNGGQFGRRDKMFKTIMGYLPDDISNDIMIKAIEDGLYEIVCFMNTLNALIANESERTVKNRVEIRKELFIYLKKVIPLLELEPHTYRTLTDIAESIMSTDELQQYCIWKEKKTQTELFECLRPT